MNLKKTTGLLLVSGVGLLAVGCGSEEGSNELSDQVASLERQVEQLEQENQQLEQRNDKLQAQVKKLRSKGEAGEDSSDETNGVDSAQTVDYPYFETPSGNIACSISESHARCEITEKTWDPGPAPANCNLDWGYGLVVEGEGEGQLLCAGDTVRVNDAPVLQYGTASQVGSFECSSEETGVTCKNNDTNHGFEISKGSYDQF